MTALSKWDRYRDNCASDNPYSSAGANKLLIKGVKLARYVSHCLGTPLPLAIAWWSLFICSCSNCSEANLFVIGLHVIENTFSGKVSDAGGNNIKAKSAPHTGGL